MNDKQHSEVFSVTSERDAAMELVRQLQEEKETSERLRKQNMRLILRINELNKQLHLLAQQLRVYEGGEEL